MRRKSSVLLLAIAVVATLFAGLLSGCTVARTGKVEKITAIEASSLGYVRVLQLTDLHLTKGKSKKEDKETLRWVKEAVSFAAADVVAVTGDAVGSLNGRDTALIQLAELFEESGVYWMYTFGNHDGEWSAATKAQCGLTGGTEGREELYAILEAYPHSLMRHGDTDGVGNYVIDVKDKETGKVVFGLVNMDTHGKYYDESGKDMGYLGVTENQVGWYEREINALAARANSDIAPTTALFMHVPLFEYTEAYNTLPHIGSFPEQNLEKKPYGPQTDVGMFAKMKELGSTNFVTAGHDHDFNWLRNYNETLFMYGKVSGINAWERRTSVGASVIDININAKKGDLGAMYKISNLSPTFEYSDYEGWDL